MAKDNENASFFGRLSGNFNVKLLKNSLYSKLITAYFAVILISFILLAVLLSFWFERYYYKQRSQALLSESAVFNGMMEAFYKGEKDQDNLNQELKSLEILLNTRIWFVDRYTLIIASSNKDENDQVGVVLQQISADEIHQVLRGSTIAKEGVFEDQFNTPTLTVAFPLIINERIIGAAVMNSPLYEINEAMKEVYNFIWVSAIIAVIISTFIIYYLTQNIIIRPLYNINKIARDISRGEFEKRVAIYSKDEIGELAESFNYMADSLQNLEAMRREFIANISHELRSPITSIRGFIQGILDGTIPKDKQRVYLDIALNESKRLTRLISDILDLSRLESGEFSLKLDNFDINEVIRINIIRLENEIDNKKLNVDVTLYGEELYVIGDRDRIGQVVSNLVDNAIKFTGEGGKIGISTRIEGKKAHITISDTGVGIPSHELKLIWDRFHMADKSRTDKRGTGLGLSIVRQIIKQHDEKIWVESKEGEGATFHFTLKLAQSI
ncbi:alkaline phosphatase synthesis sensor protein PhoR [Oxobacter pfennigii]|uniref:histidine kinase n=1 Tax=Oxobacter pfennigii TaxID=36849 RepID=A0A0P8YSY4_9CLOT|nr:HAMP domain-containing sensor histidine kinase [Oxobacter pfennigii]KPU42789.1 alkaline phosphatase synthesis sensor protein PhoR [Oxobacter pfennigii]